MLKSCKYCGLEKESFIGRKCYECKLADNRQWTKDNRERNSKRCKAWKQANKNKVIIYNKQWNKSNKAVKVGHVIARQRKIKQATPPWVNISLLEKFYQNCPQGYHVDHIIPINGKQVSGLHVLENLQYLKIADNIRKKNNIVLSSYNSYAYPVCLIS